VGARSLLDRPDMAGLTSDEASRLLRDGGANELERARSRSPWLLLAGQFASPLIWLLLGACIVSAALGEFADAGAIGTILVLNALVGFFQESGPSGRCWPCAR
jgi:Ca2+-transporting ATPase